jgi:hypothetical protein
MQAKARAGRQGRDVQPKQALYHKPGNAHHWFAITEPDTALLLRAGRIRNTSRLTAVDA